MENPVGEVMQLVSKLKLKRPDFQFRKKQGKWECTCVKAILDFRFWILDYPPITRQGFVFNPKS